MGDCQNCLHRIVGVQTHARLQEGKCRIYSKKGNTLLITQASDARVKA